MNFTHHEEDLPRRAGTCKPERQKIAIAKESGFLSQLVKNFHFYALEFDKNQ